MENFLDCEIFFFFFFVENLLDCGKIFSCGKKSLIKEKSLLAENDLDQEKILACGEVLKNNRFRPFEN